MKLSEISPSPLGQIRVETPTDAIAILSDERDKSRFIRKFGDVEIVWDEGGDVYRVPEFTEQIRKYVAYKLEQCRRWGSE